MNVNNEYNMNVNTGYNTEKPFKGTVYDLNVKLTEEMNEMSLKGDEYN